MRIKIASQKLDVSVLFAHFLFKNITFVLYVILFLDGKRLQDIFHFSAQIILQSMFALL